MICDCGILTKKRTLLDGIKSLTGKLLVFKIVQDENEELYIKRCCFMTLIPSLYTLIDKSWLTYANIIIFNPQFLQIHPEDIRVMGSDIKVQHVLKIKQITLDRLRTFGDNEFQIIYVHSALLIASEYLRAMYDLNNAYHKVINLEQTLNNLKYKYSAVVHDNELLVSTSPLTIDQIDSEEVNPNLGCDRCKDINSLKKSIKELKRDSHEKINGIQYELEINRDQNLKLLTEVSKLRDENAKLKEVNKSLYMNR